MTTVAFAAAATGELHVHHLVSAAAGATTTRTTSKSSVASAIERNTNETDAARAHLRVDGGPLPATGRERTAAARRLHRFVGHADQAIAIGDVWAAVRVLADAASSLPLHVYRKAAGGRERVESGKLVDLLERPGPGTSQADLVSSLMSHLAVYGNAYVAKYRTAGEIVQIGLLHPERVRPCLRAGSCASATRPRRGAAAAAHRADVVHVKGLSVDGLVGLRAVSQASRVLGLSDELVKHALAYFDVGTAGGSGRPAGVLRLGQGAPIEELERTQEGEGKGERAAARHPGDRGRGRVHGDHRPARRRAVRRAAPTRRPGDRPGVPDPAAHARRAHRRLADVPNVEQESIDFVRYSLTPWLRRIELAISDDPDLAFQRQFVKFETDGLLRADADTRAEVYTRALDPVTGWMDRDEVRQLEDLPPAGGRRRAPTVGNASPTKPAEAEDQPMAS